jgi:hypothetical protein
VDGLDSVVVPGERSSPVVTAATTVWRVVAPGVAGSLLLAATVPPSPRALPWAWRPTLPGFPERPGPVVAAVCFALAITGLALAWVRLLAAVRPERGPRPARIRLVVVALAAWWLPLAAAPPLLSNDVYSYVAQGTLAARGLDPTMAAPVRLGVDPAFLQVDPIWSRTPSPYGPTATVLTRAAVEVSGQGPVRSEFVLRAMVAAAVVVAAGVLASLAGRLGRDPAQALALGVANPIVTVHLIGGIHNEAWMAAAALGGLLAWRRDRRVLAFALCTLAAGVKLTGLAAVVALGWAWRPGPAGALRRAVDAAAAVAGSLAVLVVAGAAVGVGPRWITNVSNTGAVLDTFAPVTLAGRVIGAAIGAEDGAVAVVRFAGMAAGGALAWWALVRLPARPARLEHVAAVVLAAGTAAGPVLWPWYLAPLALLAGLVVPARHRPAVVVLSVGAVLAVWPLGVDTEVDLGVVGPLLQLGALAAVASTATWADRRWSTRVPGRPVWAGPRFSRRVSAIPVDAVRRAPPPSMPPR